MDELENSVVPEVAPPETQDHVPLDATPTPITVNKVDDQQDRNWKEMRQRQKDLEQKLKYHEEMNEKLLKLQLANQPVKALEVDELDAISDDEFLHKAQQKKLVKKELDPLQKRLEDLESQLHAQKQLQFIDNLRKKYSDFDEVVNVETMSLLEENDPELAQTIVELKDPYKIGMQTYKYIKAMNLTSKVPETRRSKEVEKKIESNAKTVQTPQAYDKRPMAQAFKLTDADKGELYKEMMGYASQAGFSY
jgi:hypothetical protein